MVEVLVLIGIVLITIIIAFFLLYSIFKMASFFKKTYGKSIWPGVIFASLSLDLLLLGIYIIHDEEYSSYAIGFITIALVVYVINVLSTIRKFNKHILQAVILQIVLACLQVVIFALILLNVLVKRIVRTRMGFIKRAFNWTSIIFDI